ncbi:DUF2164 domain-containing protein [Neptunomonas phycophila]|uniref:DUF2164 domain-containing protein n=1 Tax=Neptunomonas phycophila TaxID=1572645 RepID=UPI0030F96156
MSVIALEKASLEMLERRLKEYFVKELDYELGQFQAQFLLDFISQEMGAYFYNQGVRDAQAMLSSRVDDLILAFDELEKMEPRPVSTL